MRDVFIFKVIRKAVFFAMVPGCLFMAGQPGLSADQEMVSIDRSYRLNVGDRLSVKIYPEDEYLRGGDVEVGSDGNITLPLLGRIPLAGKNVLEAEAFITKLLEKDYLVDPQVSIQILEYQESNFVVLGQVGRPGTYKLPPGEIRTTLLNAISMAGGFSDIANIRRVTVRKKDGEVMRVNVENIISGRSPDIEITADDVIHVSESFF